MQLYNHNPSAQIINCTGVSKHQLLKLLLMFVTYCLDVLKQSPASIPGVLSALRYNLRHRLADCTVFDDALLGSIKAGVARLSRPDKRPRLPLTFAMVQWIIRRRTPPGHTPSDMMLATASEYASRAIVPRDDSHQFVSESVECSGSDVFVPSHLMHRHRWSEVRNIRFTVQHAKNIKIGHGVPIWFSTDDDDTDAIAFLQLVYLWAHSTTRSNTDPFLSYRTADACAISRCKRK